MRLNLHGITPAGRERATVETDEGLTLVDCGPASSPVACETARTLRWASATVAALRHLVDRVEAIELADGSTPDTLEARSILARVDGEVTEDGRPI